MPRRINQIKVIAPIAHPNRRQLNSDTLLPFQLHRVKQLLLHDPLLHCTGQLHHPVSQGRFTMIDMGNDAKVAQVRRTTHLSLPSMKRPLTIRPSLVMIGSASSILSSRDAPR